MHPLGIGGKDDPARLVFNAAKGAALNATIIDMGTRFRMVVNEVDVVAPDAPLPKLPVARALWVPRPDLKVAAAAWIHAGGAHHSGFSYAVNAQHLEDFADMAGIEYVLIDGEDRPRRSSARSCAGTPPTGTWPAGCRRESLPGIRPRECHVSFPGMQVQWFALATFVVVTTFTPGPNNISAMSLGVSSGYRRSLRFLLGITAGFFGVMCLCALLAAVLLSAFPALQPVLRIVGALYIAWLAVHTFLSSRKTEARDSAALGFANGLLLQLLNAKVIIYGLTLYSTFLGGLAGRPLPLGLFAAGFALVGFAAVSLWAGVGSSLTQVLSDRRARTIISIVLAALLMYTAVESSGLLQVLFPRPGG